MNKNNKIRGIKNYNSAYLYFKNQMEIMREEELKAKLLGNFLKGVFFAMFA